MKILFFIGSLRTGGKERQILELMQYLKYNTDCNILLVLCYDIIEYPKLFDLNIEYHIMDKNKGRKQIDIFRKFYSICKKYNPDVINCWGAMQTFYAVPTSILKKIPIVNSELRRAMPIKNKLSLNNLISNYNFLFSKIVQSNSDAAFYNLKIKKNNKYRVVYNGMDLKRFNNINYNGNGVMTKYSVVMVASFTDNKDYDRFVEICRVMERFRDDITFIAVGGGPNYKRVKEKANKYNLNNIKFTGRVTNVEEIVSHADMGILFSNSKVHGEGISNSIIEYMALGKPVIANDAGGTREIVKTNETGFLITDESDSEIVDIINKLLEDSELYNKISNKNKELAHTNFALDVMGKSFEKLFKDAVYR